MPPPETPKHSLLDTCESQKLGRKRVILCYVTLPPSLCAHGSKHCIEQEKQWDFLRELTAKISDVTAQEDSEEATGPKRGR